MGRWTAMRAHAIALVTSVALLACSGSTTSDGQPAPNTTSIFIEKILEERLERLDLLFVIDNSISMADKQAFLAQAVPQLISRLVTPVLIDGMPEIEPVTDIHIGVISSSLGSYGGNVCGDDPGPPQNDRAHLMPSVRPGLNSHAGQGFLWWDPDDTGGGQTDPSALISDFVSHVQAAGEQGCGFEASLESWYRFLIDPEPHLDVTGDANFAQTVSGIDAELRKQRTDFLRPDSLVAIIMLSDENDCSFVTENGWIGAYGANIGLTLAEGSSQCNANPNDQCCYSCVIAPPQGCASGCPGPAAEDKINLRCFNQKQRFGIDFLYPTARYVNALKSQSICPARWDLDPNVCDAGSLVQNPLYADLSGSGKPGRSQGLVYLAGIVGVPWQDIATDATRDDPNQLEYRRAVPKDDVSSESLLERWDWITGDGVNPPDDPLMVESPVPRSGSHPLGAAYNPKPVDSPADANPINGHEWNAHLTTAGDLQFACIFPLVPPKDCTTAGTSGCDCKTNVTNDMSPLCQQGASYTTTQTHAKAYPGLRQLQVLRDYGENAIVASICPKIVAGDPSSPAYGYNPAMSAIIDRLKDATCGKCFGRKLTLNEDGSLPCKLLEATYQPGLACSCNPAKGRVALATLKEGASLDKLVKQQLSKDLHCDDASVACADYCVCLVNEYQDPVKQQCLTQPEFKPNAGWCYVDPMPPPSGQSIGNPEIVAGCDPSTKRLLRFNPASGSIAYLFCMSAGAGGG
jgi:hypothetical protein